MVNKKNLENAIKELNNFKTKKSNKYNYYSYDNITNNYDFDVFFSVGTRTTGKTTATQRDIVLTEFLKTGGQFVKLCRYKDQLKPEHQSGWWTEIIMKTLHKYDIHIEYKGNRYYINSYDKYKSDTGFMINEFIKESQLLGIVIPVMRQQNYKSINYENIKNIIWDEFALQDEYSYDIGETEHFKSLLSTIVRLRTDVKMYFIGNIFTPNNPYFLLYGIDAMQLESGKVYTYIDTTIYSDPCIVVLEFGKSVTNKIEEIPRLLRVKENEQVTGMDVYNAPVQVISPDDWLLSCLDDIDKFNEFYSVAYKLITSIDESRTLKKVGNNYVFKKIEYYYIEDLYNNKIYLIQCHDDKKSFGLFLTSIFDVPEYKFCDADIRNQLPIFDMTKFRNKEVVYGDTTLYKILLERGVRL